MYRLLGGNFELSLQSKSLYNAMISPVSTYGISLWDTASTSNRKTIQRFQSKVLRSLTVNAHWYIRNDNIRQDLNVPEVKDVILE